MSNICLNYSEKTKLGCAHALRRFEIEKLASGFRICFEYREGESFFTNFILNTVSDTKIFPVVTGQVVTYDIKWEDMLSISEDRGLASIVAEPRFRTFRLDQLIAKTVGERRPIQTTFVLGTPIVTVATPYKGCSIDEADVIVFIDKSVDALGWDFTKQIQSFTPYLAQDFVRPITINGPGTIKVGEAGVFQVSAPHSQQVVYLESTAGILNRQRISGSGSVRLDTIGLSAGETIKLKAGYRYWPGDAEKLIQITPS